MIPFLEEPLLYFLLLLIIMVGLRMRLLRRHSNCKAVGTYFNTSELEENFHLSEILELGTAYAWKEIDEQPLIFQKEDSCLCIVMDPVGLTKVGVMACRMALEKIIPFYQQQTLPPKDFLKKACYLAHRYISENNNFEHGGCAIGLLYIESQQLYWASSGNIGIYLYRNDFQQLNKMDLYKHLLTDSVLQKKISKNKITNNALKNELTAYLGHENLKKIEICEQAIPLEKADQLFMATEEVYQTVSFLEMEQILNKRGLPQQKLNEIKEVFLNRQKKASRKKAVAVLASQFRK